MGKCGTRDEKQVNISGKASGEPIPLCLEISGLPRDASDLDQEDSQTLTASTSRRRRVSGSSYSRSLPPAGYASTSCRRRLSGSSYSRSLPRVYVDSEPQIRHCLLAVSPSRYGYSATKTKWPTRSSSGCWSCYGQANERKQEDCGLAVHIGMMECNNVEVFQSSRFEGYWPIRVFGAYTFESRSNRLCKPYESRYL